MFVYGWTSADSYGYPGGTEFSPVASVAEVMFDGSDGPEEIPTGDEACRTAMVTDADGHGVDGVRVDYTVDGPNAGDGFEYTNGSGSATWCYHGDLPGTDTLTAAVGQHQDRITIR